MKTKIASLCLAAILGGCASTANYSAALKTWQGSNIEDLVRVWGYPDQNGKAPNGNRLYIYSYHEQGERPTYIDPGYTTVVQKHGKTIVTNTPTMTYGGGTYDYRCKTWFEVNKDNVIVNVSMRGNDCKFTKEQRQQMSRPITL